MRRGPNTRTTFYWSDDTPEGGDDTQDACRYGNLHDETSKLLNKFEWPHAACPDDYGQTAPAGMFAPNTFGLYDVAGNVWEWVNDRYANDYYQYSPGDNPSGPDTGVSRVVRGGSWSDNPSSLRSASRDGERPGLPLLRRGLSPCED
jgi:sulfatase modifying factor 1